MPYKDPEHKKYVQRERVRRLSLERLRDEGLTPYDINDPSSQLSCDYCGRLSSRHANKEHRHYEGCFSLEAA